MEQDHLWHPDNTAEWWYFTGIGKLGDVEGVNFHVAFFRKFSRSFGKHFWFAHFGVWDGEKFHFQRKYDLNSSGDLPSGCHVGEWELNLIDPGIVTKVGNGDCLLHTPLKSPVWHYDTYYSITDMDVRGQIMNLDFRGRGWFDHTYFDASVRELLDWKYTWIALQLDDGMEIMGWWSSMKPYFLGTIVYPDNSALEPCKVEKDECQLTTIENGWLLELATEGAFELQKRVENKIQGDPEPGYIEGVLDVRNLVPIGTGYFEIAEGRCDG